MKIRRSDQVVVIAGKDRGKKGKVLKVFPDTTRAIVEGVQMLKVHSRATQVNPKGGIVHREGSIHASNLMVICPRCQKAVRLKHTVLADGSKRRACRKCGELF